MLSRFSEIYPEWYRFHEVVLKLHSAGSPLEACRGLEEFLKLRIDLLLPVDTAFSNQAMVGMLLGHIPIFAKRASLRAIPNTGTFPLQEEGGCHIFGRVKVIWKSVCAYCDRVPNDWVGALIDRNLLKS